jgi:hypothetical protein
MTSISDHSTERVVIVDDGSAITLAIYLGAKAVAAVEIDPLRALGLGSEFIDIARRRLERQRKSSATRRRGGDPYKARRRKRDEAVCALASLIAPERPLEQQARAVIDRVVRYRPVPGEVSADRQLLSQIRETGLPIPRVDRVARILRAEMRHERRQTGSLTDLRQNAPQ